MGDIPGFAGYVQAPLMNVQHSLTCLENKQICYVEYDTLVKNPKGTMQQIYQFLGEPWFEHDFNNVEDSYDEFDDSAQIKGLHTVRKKVQYIQRNPVIPSDLWNHYAGHSFWLNNDELKRSVNWITGKVNNIPQRPAMPVQKRQL